MFFHQFLFASLTFDLLYFFMATALVGILYFRLWGPSFMMNIVFHLYSLLAVRNWKFIEKESN